MRTALPVAVRKNYIIQQMYVCSAFLPGHIDCEVYITPPEGYGLNLGPEEVLKLQK